MSLRKLHMRPAPLATLSWLSCSQVYQARRSWELSCIAMLAPDYAGACQALHL